MTSPSNLAMPRLRLSLEEVRRLPLTSDRMSALVESWGSVELRWFAPRAVDPQTPHDRDEVYFVASGHARFNRGTCRMPFGDDPELHVVGEEQVAVAPGDVLFVPAGTEHHFSEISEDFGAWMMFYGPEGGEAA